MSRRDLIKMTDEELVAFLNAQLVLTCATVGPNGRPHLMPLWYVPRGTTIECWTYARSQKAKNLERNPEATLQVESGTAYEELRGVMMECDAELTKTVEDVASVGVDVSVRYVPGNLTAETAPVELREFVAAQAAKRVAIRFVPTRIVTWDHRKLGGTY
jgi:hypothetical protein